MAVKETTKKRRENVYKTRTLQKINTCGRDIDGWERENVSTSYCQRKKLTGDRATGESRQTLISCQSRAVRRWPIVEARLGPPLTPSYLL